MMEIDFRKKLEETLGLKTEKLDLSKTVEKEIERMYRKNKEEFERIGKAISQIYLNPEQGEHLSNMMSGYTSKHSGKYVIIFKTMQGKVYIDNIDRHDSAYGLR